jgi:NADPH:quinone reductase-like Zn-dependent oxidoreductase
LPPLAAGEVLVEMLAAPINPSDVLTLTGAYGMLPPLPAIGGNEGIGRVVAVGSGVTLPVGQRVVLPISTGTWTTHLVAPEAALVPLPNAGDVLQLSMVAINPPTASLLLSEFVPLDAGDWIVQNTANSAVGQYVVQLAKRRGVKTVNIVRRPEAAAAVYAAGADVVLVDGPDLGKRVAAATGNAKIRLGLDAAAGSATDRIAQCVRVGGTVVNYGAMSGESCKLAPSSFVFRDVTVRGFWVAKWIQKAPMDVKRALYGELTGLIARGELVAPVQATYALHNVREAIAAAAAGERHGKIILVP